jgi:hypothetical protein
MPKEALSVRLSKVPVTVREMGDLFIVGGDFAWV